MQTLAHIGSPLNTKSRNFRFFQFRFGFFAAGAFSENKNGVELPFEGVFVDGSFMHQYSGSPRTPNLIHLDVGRHTRVRPQPGMAAVTAPSRENIVSRFSQTMTTASATRIQVSHGCASGQNGMMSCQ